MKIFRITMEVSDLDAAATFYATLLGDPGQRHPGARHYFNCGGVILAVYDAVADGDRNPVRENAEHVYFAVGDLAAAFERASRSISASVSNSLRPSAMSSPPVARRNASGMAVNSSSSDERPMNWSICASSSSVWGT